MIAEFESRILALIDNMVDHASDDELFAGGYLRGHLTLAVAELEGEGEHSAEAIHSKVSHSLEKAIGAGAGTISADIAVVLPAPAGPTRTSMARPETP